MPTYKAPVDDTVFLLRDVFEYGKYANLPGFSEAPLDVVEQVLAEGAKFVEEVVQPLNRIGDLEGCKRHADGSVTTPKGFKEAYKASSRAAGSVLPATRNTAARACRISLPCFSASTRFRANLAFAMYPGLTNGAVAALTVHGSDELKSNYLPKMTTGEWTGTMNLTEPQCGTDLGLIKTKAVPQADGSYAITGQKIFISAGEHDLADNIIHLVLARIEGAPAGRQGHLALLVPKFLPDADGEPGDAQRRRLRLARTQDGHPRQLDRVLNYDDAKGWLVGEEHRGLPAMFVMMNGARLGVAVQGLSLSEVAYQNAAAYAKERRQGRSLKGPTEPDKPADLLLVHPDVRRMLLEIRAFNEAARALLVSVALTQEEALTSPDPKARQAADDRLGLMTPVLKGVFTDLGFANAVKAQQVLGGHGYIAEWGMEQFVRDARIAMIYEGANGVQALDLVGRKLPKDGGRAIMAFFGEISRFPRRQQGRRGARALSCRRARRPSAICSRRRCGSCRTASPTRTTPAPPRRLHAPLRLDRARLHVGADRQGGAGAAGEGRQQPGSRREIDARQVFQRAYAAGNRRASRRLTTGAATLMALPAEAF